MFNRRKICSGTAILALVAVVVIVGPSLRASAAITTAAAAPCSGRCVTTALLVDDPPSVTLICLSPCIAGCDNYNTYVPGTGTGKSCKCVGGSGSTCCHLIAGIDKEGVPFAVARGACDKECPAGDSCHLIIEVIDAHTVNASAECHDD